MVKVNEKSTTVKKVTKKTVSGKKPAAKKAVISPAEKKEVKRIVKEISTKKPVVVKKPAKTAVAVQDDMIGRKFNHITILERAGSGIDGRAVYRCGCDCGTVFLAAGTTVRVGRVKSCGCQANHGTRKHRVSTENIIGALEVLNQVCMDYDCSKDCPLWDSCHLKTKTSVKQFTRVALDEVQNKKE